MAGLTFLSLAILGAILLVVDVVAARTPAIVVTAVTAAAIASFWVAVPSYFRTREVDDEPTGPPDGLGPGAGSRPRG
jgi:hypothetical protein